jgi:hypothetical protein
MVHEKDTKVSAVYVGWTTFSNAIGTLTQAMPNRIDKTVFPGLAGGVQSQLLTGLRFLGLITKDGKPTDALRTFAVRDEPERKRQLVAILKQSYPDLFALDLSKTTDGELREQMSKSYGVAGATTDRAMRFFLAAARFAGIDISSHVKVGSSANGTPSPRRRRVPKRSHDQPLSKISPAGGGESKTVQLVSGGTLTLSATTSFLTLTPTDRTFVFGVIDKLNEYASAHPVTEAPDDVPDDTGGES